MMTRQDPHTLGANSYGRALRDRVQVPGVVIHLPPACLRGLGMLFNRASQLCGSPVRFRAP
jgi:hypothetical protein